MKKLFIKRIASIGMAVLMMICGSSIPAFAQTESTKNATEKGEINVELETTTELKPTLLSVSHTIDAKCMFDPNAGAEGQFYSDKIKIENKSKARIKVSLESFGIKDNKDYVFVKPMDKVWKSLDKADSEKYIAFGIKARQLCWKPGYNEDVYWADGNYTVSPAKYIGEIDPGSEGSFEFCGRFGLAISKVLEIKNTVGFLIELA